MEASALAQSALNRYPQAAGPIHTIFVLATLGVWAFLGRFTADQMRAAVNPHRARLYVLTLFFEWLLFFLVLAGVRRSGKPVLIVLGDRWHSVRQALRDNRNTAGFGGAAQPVDELQPRAAGQTMHAHGGVAGVVEVVNHIERQAETISQPFDEWPGALCDRSDERRVRLVIRLALDIGGEQLRAVGNALGALKARTGGRDEPGR